MLRTAQPPPSRPLALEHLAEIALGPTARVDLCRVGDGGGRLVAVKRLHPELAQDRGFVTRFLDEVWMTAALKHPNVVEVAGWGQDDQGLYLAVELVQGVSLARLVKTVKGTGEAFTERMVIYLAVCICRGLAAAHSLRGPDGTPLGLVHRDLTPGNVLLGFNGEVKITDFGLAKAKQRLTTTTVGVSSRPSLQMAPEEMDGVEIDHRADIFALGVLLFELLAGRHPWAGGSDIETLEQIAAARPPDLFELRPKVNKAIVGIVMSCLEKRPSARPQSAEALLGPLAEWLDARGYAEGNGETLARFVRRNAMRQMRWFERAIAGDAGKVPESAAEPETIRAEPATGSSRATSEDRSAATVVVKRQHLVAPPPEPPEATLSRPTDVEITRDRDWEVETLVHRRDAAGEALAASGEPEIEDELSLRDAEEILDRDPEDNAPTLAMRQATQGVMRGALLRSSSGPSPARPAPDPSSVRASPPPRPPPTAPAIQAEADRLRSVAAMWAEGAARAAAKARTAAAQAEHAAELARIAGEAAVLAGQAADLARSADPGDGERRLARALELERSLATAAREPQGR